MRSPGYPHAELCRPEEVLQGVRQGLQVHAGESMSSTSERGEDVRGIGSCLAFLLGACAGLSQWSQALHGTRRCGGIDVGNVFAGRRASVLEGSRPICASGSALEADPRGSLLDRDKRQVQPHVHHGSSFVGRQAQNHLLPLPSMHLVGGLQSCNATTRPPPSPDNRPSRDE